MDGRPITLRTHDDGRDRWRMADAAPAAALAGIVEGYSDWEEQTTTFTARRELALTGGVFIVNLGAPLDIVDAQGDVRRFAAGEGFVGGMAEATSLSHSNGAMAGAHVFLPVSRLAALLDVSVADLTGCVVRLDDLPGDIRTLGTRLADAPDAIARFDLLDTFLLERAARARPVDTMLAHTLRLLQRPGARAVAEAAAALDWSRKRLAVRVRDATGLLPRNIVRLARFDRFGAALRAEPAAGFAALAASAGYADQAHLARDVRRLANMTPRDLRRRLVPDGGGVRHD